MTQCCVRVWKGILRGRLCELPAVKTVGGKSYCRVHDPAVVAARHAAKDAKIDAQIAAGRRERELSMWRAQCVELVERIAAGSGYGAAERACKDMLARKPR